MNKMLMTPVVKMAGEEVDRVLRFVGTDESFDRMGDLIEFDGWDFKAFEKNPVFLWAHDKGTPPIGKVIKLEKDIKGKRVMFDVQFPKMEEMTDPMNPSEHAKFTDSIYRMYQNGFLSAVSVGFNSRDFERMADGGLRFKSQELLELSAVPVPANANALQAAKAFGIDNQVIQAVEKAGAKLSKKAKEILAKARDAIRELEEYAEMLESPKGEEEKAVEVQPAPEIKEEINLEALSLEKVNAALSGDKGGQE